MVEALLGKKVGMTSVYDATGKLTPVTVIELGPCTVVQVRTPEVDGYSALQLGFGERRPKNVTKPVRGHYKKAGTTPKRFLREVGWDAAEEMKPGATLTAELFAEEKKVDVIGTVRGRGFQGTVKRHGFGGGPRTHGQCDRLRAPGSIGSNTYPGRVIKGKRMAGRMGGNRFTVRNLRVVRVDAQHNAILVKGAVPGPNSGYVIVRRATTARDLQQAARAADQAAKAAEQAKAKAATQAKPGARQQGQAAKK